MIESMSLEDSYGRRAAIHAALGEPVRVAIADTLALGDASPGRLAAELGVSSNLLAHHLNVLEAAGVLERSRSSGDRRRTFVRLRPDVSALVAAPVLVAPRIVFVCTQNSARSQLAAALWRGRSRLPAASAGTRPAARVHPGAVAVARRRGVRLDRHRTAHVDDVLHDGDLVVTVCDSAYDELRERSRLHWSVADPVSAGTASAFDEAFDALDHRIGHLAGSLRPVGKDSP